MQRKLIIVGILVIFVGIPFILFLFGGNKPNFTNNPTITPTILPASYVPTPFIPITPAKNQGQADQNYSNQINHIYTSYPWYSKLPLQTNDYFVYFDVNQKQFIGKIYSQSNNLSQTQTDSIKNTVISHLQNLGVDTTTYPIQWVTGI